MSTPFLLAFANAVLARLTAAEAAIVTPGSEERAVRFVAAWLERRSQGGSLISSLEQALLACPEVEDLFVDLDGLKELVDDLAHP